MGILKNKVDLRLLDEGDFDGIENDADGESGLAAADEAQLRGDVAGCVQSAFEEGGLATLSVSKPETVIHGEKEVLIDGRRQKFVLRDFNYHDGTGYKGRYSARLWVAVDEEGKIIDLVGGLLVDQPLDERDEWSREGVYLDLAAFWEGKKFGRLRDGRVVYDKRARTVTVHLPVRRGDALSEEALDEGFYLQGAWGGERNGRAAPRDFHKRFVRPHCPDDEGDNPFAWAARRAAVAKGCLFGVADQFVDERPLDYEDIDEIYRALAQRKFNIAPQDAFEPKSYERNKHNLALCGKVEKHFRIRQREDDWQEEHRADLTYFVLECGEFLTPEMFDDPKVQELLYDLGNCFAQGLSVSRMVAVFKQAMGENGGFSDAEGVRVDADRESLLKRSREALIFTLEMVEEVFGGYNSVFDRWFLVEDFDLSCGFDPGSVEGRGVMLLLAKKAKANFANAAAIFHKCRKMAAFESVEVAALADFAVEAGSCFPGDNFNVDKVIGWAAKHVAAMEASEQSSALRLLAGRLHSGTYLYRGTAFNGLPVEDYELRGADEVKVELVQTANVNVRGAEESARLGYERAEQDKRRGVWGVSSVKPRDHKALAAKAADRVNHLVVGLAGNVRYLPGSDRAALPVSPERSAVCAFARERVMKAVLEYRDYSRTCDREKILFFRCFEPFLPEFVGDCSVRIAKIVRGLADMRTAEPDFLPYLSVVSGGRSGWDGCFKSGLCEYFGVARSPGDFHRRNEDDDRYHAQIEELVVEILVMAKDGAIDFEDALNVLEWLSERPASWGALRILGGEVRAFRSVMLEKCYPRHYEPEHRERLLDGDVAATLQNEIGMAKLAYLCRVLEVLPLARDYAVAIGEPQSFRNIFARLVENGRRGIVVERPDECIDYGEVFPGSEPRYSGSGAYRAPTFEAASLLRELFDEGLLDRAAFDAVFDDLKAAHALRRTYPVLMSAYGRWRETIECFFSDVSTLVKFLYHFDYKKLLLEALPDVCKWLTELPLAGESFVLKLLAIFERRALGKVSGYVEQKWLTVLSDVDFVGILRDAKVIAQGDGVASTDCAEILRLRLGHAYTLTLELLGRKLLDFSTSLKTGKSSAVALVKFLEGVLKGEFLNELAEIWQKSVELQALLSGVSELFGRRFDAMAEKIIDDVGVEGGEMGDLHLDVLEIGRMCFSAIVAKCILGQNLPDDLASANSLVLTAVFKAQADSGEKLLREVNGLALEGAAENDGGIATVSAGVRTVRETVRRIADFSGKKLEVLVQALRKERIKAFGMVPTGGKIHLAKEVDNEILQRILSGHGLSSTSFWVDGSKCVVCPAVPSNGEFVGFLRALAAQGLIDESKAAFQLCAVPRLSAYDGAVVGCVMMLRTKKPYPIAEGLFETSHDAYTGRRLLIHDACGYMANLPFMPKGGKDMGRTDIVGRIAFDDASLWQFLRTMHRDKDGGIFGGLWAEFVERYVAIMAVHGMPDVINNHWILPQCAHSGSLSPDEIEARSKGQAIHFATLKRCTDAVFEYMRLHRETGEMSGVVYDIILLCNEMQERMRAVQVRILGEDEFRNERRLLLGNEDPVSAEEFYMCLQKT